ncbi:MAG: hypothetical protein U0S49_14415 [Rhodospirillales bacterium]|nr:hypothetical protein [Rhodospirillales bacterium]
MLTNRRSARLAARLVLACALLQAAPGQALSAAPVTAKPAAVVLPRHPAPLGLSFGMRPDEVPLPAVVPPAPLGAVAPLRTLPPGPGGDVARSDVTAAVPTPLVPSAPMARSYRPASGPADILAPLPPRPAAGALPARVPLDGLGDYLRACEAAFDRISALAGGGRDWLAWRARHLQGGEGSDFSGDVADRAGLSVAPAATLVRAADGWRSAGLYRFDGADGRRLVCLLFTSNGLAQVFLAGHALDGLRDEVIVRLERQRRRLDSFAMTREARRFSLSLRRPACGIYCRLFGERMLVERRLWLHPGERILVAAKRGLIASGLTGAFSGGGESEVFGGLPDSFLVSIDLGRRAFVLRQPSAAAPAAGGGPAGAQASAPQPVGAAPAAVVESFVP